MISRSLLSQSIHRLFKHRICQKTVTVSTHRRVRIGQSPIFTLQYVEYWLIWIITSIEQCLINQWIDCESNDREIIKFLIFLLRIGILFCDPTDVYGQFHLVVYKKTNFEEKKATNNSNNNQNNKNTLLWCGIQKNSMKKLS